MAPPSVSRSPVTQSRALQSRAIGALVALTLFGLLAACAGPGRPASQTILNENRELQGVIRSQEVRIDELSRQRNDMERRLEAASEAPGEQTGAATPGLAKPDMSARAQQVHERFKSDSDVEVEPLPDGYRFVMREQVLFGSASAELTEDGRAALQRVADSLRGRGTRIVVEGHTDNVKLVNATALQQYPRGNIELSVARALAVWDSLVQDGRLDQSRLAVVGYGPHRPRLPNDSERNRYRNRRVEIRVSEPR